MKEHERSCLGRGAHARRLAVFTVWALGGALSPLAAQTPAFPPSGGVAAPAVRTAVHEAAPGVLSPLQLTGCSSCDSCVGPVPHLGGSAAPCYPGRYPCDCDRDAGSGVGGFLMGVYQAICCNDPCYESRWKALPNAAFFVDQVRPKTQMKIGVDLGSQLRFPDKAELFWGRIGVKGPAARARTLDYTDGYLYTEGAVDRFGLFVQLPYRHVEPDGFANGSGFGDMILGTKSLILDSELIQVTFQFKTYLPTGNAIKGVGTGHTSLEPSLIAAIKCSSISYLQTQIGYLFPIAGDPAFQGSLFSLGASYNHQLWCCGEDLQLIGTLESNLWCITNGQFSDPALVGANNQLLPQQASSLNPFWNLGLGLRLVLCNKVDFGIGFSGAVTDDRLWGHLLRTEFRWRF